MEALGVASSIAGLISITEVIVFKTSKFYSLAKGARSDVRDLLAEVQSLYGVLSSLKLLATCLEDDEPYYAKSKNIPRLDHFQTCRQNLDILKKSLAGMDLDSAKGLAATKIYLLWPFKVGETKELLEKIQRNKSDLSDALTADGIASLVNALSTTQSRLAEDIANVQRELQRAADEKAENEMDENKRKIFDWCSKADPYSKHRNSKDLRHPNTLTWLFDSPEYKKWIEDANSALWLYGIPGAGKTILSSAVIEDAKKLANQRPGHAIAYYYCEHRLKETQMPSNILGSMIKQICAGSEEAFDEVDLFYAQHNEKGKHPVLPTSEDLCKLLKRLSRHFESVMIVVDGLDECALPEERITMLKLFSTLNAPDQGNIKTIFASRDEVDIRDNFSKLESISIAARGTDLELFVAAGIELRINNKSLRLKDPSLKETIIDGIVSKANGMFQWAKCQLDHLCLLSTDRERRRALESLPKDLFETYKRILDRVNEGSEGNKSLVERTLRWLCFSPEQLSIDELTTVVAIEVKSKFLHSDDIPDEHSLLWWCSSLVSKDKSGIVSLTHFTVKEFLMDKKLLDFPSLRRYHMDKDLSDTILAKVSITYLNFPEFSKLSLDIEPDEAKDIFKKFPVLRIAGSAWPACAGGHDDDEELFDLACRILNPRKPHSFLLWLSLLFAEPGKAIPKSTPTLHFAASFGLSRVCDWLLGKGADVGFNDSFYATPLICSIRGMTNWDEWEGMTLDGLSNGNGMPNPETVRVVLKHGGSKSATATITKPVISRNVEDLRKVTPMALALDLIYSNKELGCTIFKLLLDSDAISSFANSTFWTRCERLSSERLGPDWRQDLVELFMETLEHPSAHSLDSLSREKMLLFVTSYGKSLEGAELESLQIGAGGIFSSDRAIEQLIWSAAENGQKHLIEDLIAKDVDPTILSQGLSPAATSGFADIVELLLKNCPPKKHPDLLAIKKGWVEAALEGKVDCLKVFLDHETSVNMPIQYYYPQFIRGNGLRERPEPNETSPGTALACAVHHGVLEAVLFLSSLPDTNFRFKSNGQSLLHLAAQAPANRTEIVQCLLSKGLDPLEVSEDGRTMLHHLLANPTFKDKDFELLTKFRELGCTLDVVDHQGNSLLHVLFDENIFHGFYQDEDPTDDFDQDHIYKVASYLIENHDMRSTARKDGLLPMQVALRRRLPTRFIEISIPSDPSIWNCSGSAQYSPLHEAVEPAGNYSRYYDEEASLRMFNILIDRDGLDVSVVDSRGQTPYLLLCDKSYKGAPPSRAQMIRKLLEAGSDVNAKGENEWRAVNCLAVSAFAGGLSEVLQYKPEVQVLNDIGHSPLHDAIERGHIDIIQLLIDQCGILGEGNDRTKIDLKQKTSGGLNPIHVAAMHNRDEILQLLYETKKADDIDAPTMNAVKMSGLHYAVERHHASTILCLLNLGANVNCRDAYSATPLHYAADNGFKDIALLLVENGADVTVEDSSGVTPWLAAAIKGHSELKDSLYELLNAETMKRKEESRSKRENPAGNLYLKRAGTIELDSAQLRAGALVNALERNDLSVCKALLDSRNKPDEPLDQYRRTALHIAAGQPWSTGVQMLLEMDASTRVKDIYGNEALHCAAMAGLELNIEILSSEADLQARNDHLESPLHLAAKAGHTEAVRKILTWHALSESPSKDDSDNTASQPEPSDSNQKYVWIKRDQSRHSKFINALDFQRKTPLMMAIEGKWVDTAILLLEEGADFGIKDVNSRDSFCEAGHCFSKPLICRMLAQDADTNASDYLGFTALHTLACNTLPNDKSGLVIARILMEHGAKLHSDNLVNVSPLHCAASYGNKRLVTEFLRLMPKEEVNVESKYFGTPIYAAAFRGWRGVVTILLNAGANPDIGLNGETPLEAAKKCGHKKMVRLFEWYFAREKRRKDPWNRLLEWKPDNVNSDGQADNSIRLLSRHPRISVEALRKLEGNPALFHPFSPLAIL